MIKKGTFLQFSKWPFKRAFLKSQEKSWSLIRKKQNFSNFLIKINGNFWFFCLFYNFDFFHRKLQKSHFFDFFWKNFKKWHFSKFWKIKIGISRFARKNKSIYMGENEINFVFTLKNSQKIFRLASLAKLICWSLQKNYLLKKRSYPLFYPRISGENL